VRSTRSMIGARPSGGKAELIDELKRDYTIVIVTHNMQQAARVSDFTAFLYLGVAHRVRTYSGDLHLAA